MCWVPLQRTTARLLLASAFSVNITILLPGFLNSACLALAFERKEARPARLLAGTQCKASAWPRGSSAPGMFSECRRGLTSSFTPPPKTAAHMRLLRGCAASRNSSLHELVASAWIRRLRYTATTASHSRMFNFGWSSSWAELKRLISELTPAKRKNSGIKWVGGQMDKKKTFYLYISWWTLVTTWCFYSDKTHY